MAGRRCLRGALPAATFLAATFLARCFPATEPLGRVPLESSQSLVYVVAIAAAPRLEARDLNADPAPTLQLRVDHDATLYALTYVSPLSQLGLSAGALTLGDARPVPPPDGVFHQRLGG